MFLERCCDKQTNRKTNRKKLKERVWCLLMNIYSTITRMRILFSTIVLQLFIFTFVDSKPQQPRRSRDSSLTMHNMATIPFSMVLPRPLKEVPRLIVPSKNENLETDFPAFYHNNFVNKKDDSDIVKYMNKAPIVFGGIINNLNNDGYIESNSPEGKSIIKGIFEELGLSNSTYQS